MNNTEIRNLFTSSNYQQFSLAATYLLFTLSAIINADCNAYDEYTRLYMTMTYNNKNVVLKVSTCFERRLARACRACATSIRFLRLRIVSSTAGSLKSHICRYVTGNATITIKKIVN